MRIDTVLDRGAAAPAYQAKGDAGADVRALLDKDVILMAHHSALIPTGVHVAVPEGYEIQVRPRSGLALKNQITVLNTPGTIDCGYRGGIGVILINHGKSDFIIRNGDRIAQLVLNKVEYADFNVVDSLDETDRGEGFGSSGVK